MRGVVGLIAALVLGGCVSQPERESQTAGRAQLGYLGELDGCGFYRVVDNPRIVYFMRCPGHPPVGGVK